MSAFAIPAEMSHTGKTVKFWWISQMSSVRTRLSPNGRIVIPAAFRRALGLKSGDEVVITLGEDELRLSTSRHALRRLQTLVRKHVPKGVSLADELIRERRDEASRD